MASLELPFTAPWLLAPMEGVTDPCFRDLVLERHAPDQLGGAYTEFVRVVRSALPERVLLRHLGPRRYPIPVGIQLMGADRGAVAETAARAEAVGAPLVDLNFGCPSKGALRGCAGSALLDDPSGVEALVRVCAEAVRGVPVTAKIRAGGEDTSLLEELCLAAQEGGAALLTVHARTRAEKYAVDADWSRLARAAAAVDIPVCGNGGVEEHADLERLRRETGCAYAMVGRAALGDPWIFGGRRVGRREAADFLLEYVERLKGEGGASFKQATARAKQLLKTWAAGQLVDDHTAYLRENDPQRLIDRIRAAAELEASAP